MISPAQRLAYLHTVVLDRGTHTAYLDDQGMPTAACLMEAAAWIAGEPWGDKPACVCLVIREAGVAFNDSLPQPLRQQLVPLIPAMLDTVYDGMTRQRWEYARRWGLSYAAPMWLDVLGQSALAARLRAADGVVDDALRQYVATIFALLQEKYRIRLSSTQPTSEWTWDQAVAFSEQSTVVDVIRHGVDPMLQPFRRFEVAATAALLVSDPRDLFVAVMREAGSAFGRSDVQNYVEGRFGPLVRQLQQDGINMFSEIVHMRPAGF